MTTPYRRLLSDRPFVRMLCTGCAEDRRLFVDTDTEARRMLGLGIPERLKHEGCEGLEKGLRNEWVAYRVGYAASASVHSGTAS